MPPKKPKAKATTRMSNKPIREDFELSSSSEETKVVKIDEEKRMKSKDITFSCPHCNGKLILQNSIEINPISFSFNRLTTPESDEEKKKYEMIQDVMGTPRSKPL